MDIKSLSITQALKDLRSKKITAVELVEACLENIEKSNKEYNVFLTVADREALLHEAKQADATDHSLPLSGIPVALKDLFSTKSLRTTAGSKVLDNYVPKYDSTVVKKLKEAGAIIIGKVNEDAWGHGSSGENSDFGPTGNAFNKDYVAGGSSSGSAVAVALGMCLVATGTDTGGSIRVPAAFNNLVGLKPTYGRVSRYGVIAMASSLDSIGHITKTVEDAAYFLNITAGQDPYDATTGTEPVKNYLKDLKRESLKGLKIAIPKEVLDDELEISKNFKLARLKFETLGAEITEVSMPNLLAGLETYYIIVPSEVSSNLGRMDGIRYGNSREAFGPEAKRRMMIGTYALSSGYYDAYYKTAQKVRTLICNEFKKVFEKFDTILMPVTPTTPAKIGEKINDPIAQYMSDLYTIPVNLAGVPAISLPSGLIKDLPVGIQLVGPQWSEDLLFSIGKVYEQS